MGNFDWQYVIDGAAALYGLYVLMSALKMKATGEISSFVASPEEMNKCKRKRICQDGFRKDDSLWISNFFVWHQ